MQLSLYHVVDTATGYDVYSDWVVAARSHKQALAINPGNTDNPLVINNASCVWSKTAKSTFIGRACVNIRSPEIICASFHAG